MKIREAKVEDALDMSRVNAETWKVAYKGIFSQSYLQNLQDSAWQEGFKRGILANKNIFLVAEVNNDIVGCIIGGKNRWQDDVKGEIYSLYVLPEFQGKGIGTALIQNMLDKLYNIYPSVQVLVVDKNKSARTFYESVGFVDTHQIHQSELNGGTFLSCIYEIVKRNCEVGQI